MSKLPEKFTATDPVTGLPIEFKKHKNHVGYFLADGRSLRANWVRALIQYGRDLERARMKNSVDETIEALSDDDLLSLHDKLKVLGSD